MIGHFQRIVPFTLSFGLLMSFARDAGAGTLGLDNERLSLRVNPADGTWTAADKRNGHVWRQEARGGPWIFEIPKSQPSPSIVRIRANSAESSFEVDVRLVENEPEILAVVRSLDEPTTGMGPQPSYPFPFTLPEDEGHFVQCCDGDGAIFPLAEREKIQGLYEFGVCMPWWGVTDLNKGCMAIAEGFQQGGSFEYPVTVRYRFFTEGGYVAMARYYRMRVLANSPMEKFEERARKNPRLNVLRDGVEAYLWGTARSKEMIEELDKAGIRKAMLMWDPNHPPVITTDLVVCMAEHGYTPGMYETYNVIADPAAADFAPASPESDRRTTLAKLDYALRTEDQKYLRRAPFLRTCSKMQLEWATARIPYELNRAPYQAHFFDTMVVQLAACYDPKHPCTLQEARQARIGIFEMARAMGQIVGSGEGNSPDWAVPYLDYLEGALTLRPYTRGARAPRGVDMENAEGKFENHWKPARMFESGGAPDERGIPLNEYYRIPLMELVYHDYVTLTWFWADQNERHDALWWKKDLFNALWGNMPMWQLSLDEWRAKSGRYVESYKRLQSVREKVGFADMVDHRWLTEDRKVQQADYDSGYSVVANFGGQPYQLADGSVVPPRSHMVLAR